MDMDVDVDVESRGLDSLSLKSGLTHPTQPAESTRSNTSGKRRARVVITDLLEPGNETPKYEFEMELGLRETGRGK